MTSRTKDDEHFMRLAIGQAIAGDNSGNSSIGCIVAMDGLVVASGHNQVDTDHDPTAHAEIVTIRATGQVLATPEFRGATLYSTLQPCGMCTLACLWAKISRIVYGASREDVHPMYFVDRHLDIEDFIRDAYRNDVELLSGVLKEECAALYYRPWQDVPPEVQGNI